MKLNISTSLYCSPATIINLPINSWDEIKDWYIKWDTLHYTLDGTSWEEYELGSDISDSVDWKRPVGVLISDPDNGMVFHEE